MTRFETELKMVEKSCEFARRTWKVLRVALVFNRLIKEVRRSVKSIGGEKRNARIQYGERQLSFDRTPLVHVKMSRPTSMWPFFPCINSGPNFDCGFEEDEWGEYYLSDDEIDSRAQKFIDEFYEQIKLQSRACRYIQN